MKYEVELGDREVAECEGARTPETLLTYAL